MSQQFFVSRGRTIRGPVTDRKKVTHNGKVSFVGTAGAVYTPTDERGNPVPLPSGFVEYARGKKETNGRTLLDNLIADGSIVFEAGARSPVEFAKAFGTELVAAGGVIHEEKS